MQMSNDSWLVNELAAICPDFVSFFEEHRRVWTEPPAKRPSDFGILTIFADYLLQSYSDLSEPQKIKLSDFIEQHVRYPVEPFTNGLLVGIFESLEDTPIAKDFAQHLGPVSRKRFHL